MADDTRQLRPEGERTEIPSWGTVASAPSPPAPGVPGTKPLPSEPRSSLPRSNAVPLSTAPSETNHSRRAGEIVNEMPGGTANTAGGEKIQDYSAWGVLRSIRPSEYTHFHRLPCVRDALLTGIGCGFGAGGLAFVLGRATWTACNWSVWGFLGTSYGSYEWCKSQLKREKAGMKRAVEVMDAKRIEKDKRMEEARETRRRERREREDAEEKARLEEERRKRQWYRFW